MHKGQVSAHGDNDLHAASARQTGRRACLAKPSFTSKATSMACGCPTGPVRCEARLNSRFANVKSLRHCRRLKPRPGHLSACLTGPAGRIGAVLSLQAMSCSPSLSSSFPTSLSSLESAAGAQHTSNSGYRIRKSCGIFTSIGFVIVCFYGQCTAYGRVARSHTTPGQPGKSVGRLFAVLKYPAALSTGAAFNESNRSSAP